MVELKPIYREDIIQQLPNSIVYFVPFVRNNRGENCFQVGDTVEILSIPNPCIRQAMKAKGLCKDKTDFEMYQARITSIISYTLSNEEVAYILNVNSSGTEFGLHPRWVRKVNE